MQFFLCVILLLRLLLSVTDMNDYGALVKLIQESEIITIFGHAFPDGDCYGCQIGLRELIRDNFPGKRVYAVGSGLPGFFTRLSTMDVVDDETIAASTAILVDVSCLRRVEDPRVYNARAFGKVDHHQPSDLEPFEGVAVVESDRIAAGEILAEIALAYKWKISTLAAECLYLGICTDSGRFAYQGTTKRTLEIVQVLKRRHIQIRSIHEIAYYESPERKKMKAIIRRKAKTYEGVVYCVIKKQQFERCGLTADEALHQVNALARVDREAHCYALFVYFDDDQINVELRSNNGYPVHGVAMKYGGGGHRFASGCTIYASQNEVEDVVRDMALIQKGETNAGV